MRLINADAVIEDAFNLMDRDELLEDVPQIIKDYCDAQPTIDAVSDKHCKNVGTDYADVDQFVCSECGLELQEWVRVERDEDDGEVTHHEYVFRYCPHCGARIDYE